MIPWLMGQNEADLSPNITPRNSRDCWLLHLDVSGSCLGQTAAMNTGTSVQPQWTMLDYDASDKQAAMQLLSKEGNPDLPG